MDKLSLPTPYDSEIVLNIANENKQHVKASILLGLLHLKITVGVN